MLVNKKAIVRRGKKRVGRGYGSGKGGHTAGRGTKGQKARNKIGVLFEGIKTRKSALKRTPQLRGKSKFNAKTKPVVINLSELSGFKRGEKITLDKIIKVGIVDEKSARTRGVKVLGRGKNNKYNIERLLVSKRVEKKISSK